MKCGNASAILPEAGPVIIANKHYFSKEKHKKDILPDFVSFEAHFKSRLSHPLLLTSVGIVIISLSVTRLPGRIPGDGSAAK
jgi:hypothetical protein